MATTKQEDKYFSQLTQDELWQRYCGFLHLSLDEFASIQKSLLLDSLGIIQKSELGRKILGGKNITSVEEFRRNVPFTTYADYEPYLSEQNETALAFKPQFWCHSAGRGGFFKWIPHSSESVDKAVRNTIASMILASAREKGEVNVFPGFKFLSVLAPIPYSSGCLFRVLRERFTFTMIPNPEKSEDLPITDRFKKGFEDALREGPDIIGAISSVLVRMGEIMEGEASSRNFSATYLHPVVIGRLIRGALSARREKRKMLPRDLWHTRAIMASGMDTSIYKDAIVRYWGTEPYELYGITETYFLALQSWRRKGMVFLPDTAFLEFIPYDEKQEKVDNPPTVLLSELEAGKQYELVVSNFTGMPLLRYRVRDVLVVTSIGDEEAGIKLPHIMVQRRADEIINLGNLAWLDEKTIIMALAKTGIKFADWIACKEVDGARPYLRLYIELRSPDEDKSKIAPMIDAALKEVDTDYKDVEYYLGHSPLKMTYLSGGTFEKYTNKQIAAGADLAHLKPLHLNPPENIVKDILEISASGG